MALVKSTSIHILQTVANSLLVDKVRKWCHMLLLPARISSLDLIGNRMSSVIPHLTFTTKFAANFYRPDESLLCGLS